MEKKTYITEEERAKCRKVAEAFAELEDVDVVVVDAGRYGFVKLQYYMPPAGFENDYTFTDSRSLFEDLWEELFQGTPDYPPEANRDIPRKKAGEEKREENEKKTRRH